MKITDTEVVQNNVKSAPDTLRAEGNVTTREIKHIFDKLPELIVEKFNAFVDMVTADYYTKAQTDSAIEQKVVEVGAADMQKAVYDSDNDGVVDSAMRAVNAENAYTLNGQAAECFALKTDVEAVQQQALTAKQTADAAHTAAQTAQQTAYSKAEAVHTQSASTVSAGTFAGDVVAFGVNRDTSGGCVRNCVVVSSGSSPSENLVSTNSIIFSRS